MIEKRLFITTANEWRVFVHCFYSCLAFTDTPSYVLAFATSVAFTESVRCEVTLSVNGHSLRGRFEAAFAADPFPYAEKKVSERKNVVHYHSLSRK